MFGAQALADRLKGFRLPFLEAQHIVAANDQTDLVLAEFKLSLLKFIAMQHKVEIVLIGVDLLALEVIQDVFLDQRVERKDVADGRQVSRLVETPLFVDSRLTSMVQLADLCAYAVRRNFENGETDLLDRFYDRFDRAAGRLVGIRHYTGKQACNCRICVDHGRPAPRARR